MDGMTSVKILIISVAFSVFLLPYVLCQGGTTQSTSSQPPTTIPVEPTTRPTEENTTSSLNATSQPTPGTNNSTATPTTNATEANTTASPETNSTSSPSQTSDRTTTPTEESATEPSAVPSATPSADALPTDSSEDPYPEYFQLCPSGLPCDKLSGDCLNCSFDTSCVYGREYNTTCIPKTGLDCIGSLPIERTYTCKYCYQTDVWQQSCTPANDCHVYACPKEYKRVNCTVHDDVLCLGTRKFYRRKVCNWTSGYKWSYALLASIIGGGFGADRFYLGYWQSGLGKLFSFGGAGVWTLIDVLLIAVGYIAPSDGSHYI